MAFGIKQLFTRFLPPKKYPPISLRVVDSYGATELAQTAALILYLKTQLDPKLSHINANLTRINDNLTGMSLAISNLNAAILSLASIKNQQNAILASQAANQVTTNTFFKLVNAEKAVLDSIEEQLKEAVKLGVELDQMIRITAAGTTFMNSVTDSAAEIIKQTAVYQTLDSFVNNFKASIASVLPNSPRSVASITKAGLGLPATPE